MSWDHRADVRNRSDPDLDLATVRGRSKRPRRLVTVCAWCRRIRDESGVWRKARLPAFRTPTHGICGRCIRRHFPPEIFPESSD